MADLFLNLSKCLRMKKTSLLVISIIFFSFQSFAQQATGSITGNVVNDQNAAVPYAAIYIKDLQMGTNSNKDGAFTMHDVPPGHVELMVSAIGYKPVSRTVTVQSGETSTINFSMITDNTVLQQVVITGQKDYNNVKHMAEVEGTLIYSGKRNDVVILDKTNANTAQNIPRQVFSKVPGVYEWDFDGSGNQTSIAIRGLSPHRSWEFNVRENGYTINSDVFGYPECHYNPATEAIAKVELVRGGACLQYGPQYGGMLNYVMKEGPTDKKVDYETRATYGSKDLFDSYNAIGGQVGKLNYYGYINFRNSNGYRPNGEYTFYAGYIGLHYAFTKNLTVGFEYSKMYYVDQLSGGLTDAQFEEDPYQSTRSRNYFQPNHNIPALTVDYNINPTTTLSLKSNMIIGQRNSVMFIAPPTVPDSINPATLTYAPRQVDRDYYNSITNELRILHHYNIGKLDQVFSAGLRYSDSKTHRQQQGPGTTASDFDLSLTGPYGLDLHFTTINYAFCAENLFRVTKKLSITPGVRYEIIQTNMEGNIDFTTLNFDYDKNRNIPLGGLGIQYNLRGQNNIYANITQAYRPILYSDITPTATLDSIDKNMKDSRGFNSDIGIRGRIKDYLIYDIGGYCLKYGDRIGALQLTDPATGNKYIYKTNIGTSVATGAEFLVEFHPTAFNDAGKRIGDLAIFVSGAYDHAVYVDAITSANGQSVELEGNKLENAPEWILSDGITYNYRFLSTTVQSYYVSQIYSDALNTEFSENGVVGIVPSYLIVDWNATVRFSSFNIKAGINNLGDKVYFTRRINTYPGPGILPADGRTFYISVGKEF